MSRQGPTQTDQLSLPPVQELTEESNSPPMDASARHYSQAPEGERRPGLLLRDEARDRVQSFDFIYRTYERGLSRYVSHLVHGDHDLIQEIMQDTFLKIWQALPQVKGDLSIQAWIQCIAMHAAYDVFRRQRRTVVFSYEQVPGSLEIERVDDPQEEYEQAEPIRLALDALPALDRRILLLWTYGRYTYREIASMTGLTVNAVKMRLRRARESFRDHYLSLVQL